jgi:hypothetical protein
LEKITIQYPPLKIKARGKNSKKPLGTNGRLNLKIESAEITIQYLPLVMEIRGENSKKNRFEKNGRFNLKTKSSKSLLNNHKKRSFCLHSA